MDVNCPVNELHEDVSPVRVGVHVTHHDDLLPQLHPACDVTSERNGLRPKTR